MTTTQTISYKFLRLLLFPIFVSLGFDANATEFFVSPSGNDKADGLSSAPKNATEGPFLTLGRAQQAIRILKQSNRFNDSVTVHVQGGIYELSSALTFDARDSGTQNKPVIWQGDPDSVAIIYGGRTLNCELAKGAIYGCPFSEDISLPKKEVGPDRLDSISPNFRVFIKDTKLKVARWPNNGWAHIKQAIEKNTSYTAVESLPDLRGEIGAAQVHIFPGYGWYDEYLDILSIDQQLNSISLQKNTKHPLSSGRQFIIQNHTALLDSPGEWFYDSHQKAIMLIPPAGVNGNAVTVTQATNLLSINGANNLTFRNFTLQYSKNTAIFVNKSHYLSFEKLSINNIATKAIDIYESDNIQIRNNNIHDTGGGGIYVNGGDTALLKSSNNTIENNHLYNISDDILTSNPAILVSGVGATVRHNLIEHSSNLGVMIYGNNHIIEKNELHHLCQECADCGGIYSGGNWTIRGNTIRYNYIHDIIGYGLDHFDPILNEAIYTSPREGRGIYIDNGGSGFEITGNILVNPGDIGIHLNGGRDNKVQANYINTSNTAIWIQNIEKFMEWDSLQSKLAQSPYKSKVWVKAYPELTKPMNKYFWPENNAITGNILVRNGAPTTFPFLRYDIPDQSTTISKNLIWSSSEPIKVRYESLGKAAHVVLGWSEWSQGAHEFNSIFIDPCISLAGKTLNACPNSPISQIGFQPIPEDIGLTNP